MLFLLICVIDAFWLSAQSTNYITEITPRIAQSHIDTAIQVSSDSTQPIVKRTYYDAMYRPTLTYLYGYTPNHHHHLVTLNEYDSYARPTKEWLPIVTEIDCLTNATFKNDATLFYNNDSRPFWEHIYSTETWDNGTIKNELAGIQKAGADMRGHKMDFVSRGNDSKEVRLFKVISEGLLEATGFYYANALFVTETKDEDDVTKVVYTNLRDQVVMEKVNNECTYYVYNDLNQLCYVLPPLVAQQITEGTHSDTIDVMKKYAYVYKYDERGNQIYKRLPGCEPILMVYDTTNVLVMSQTGNQRGRGTYWTVYKYDELRRLIYTAEVNTKSNNHAELMDNFSQWYVVERFSIGNQTYPMANTGYSRGYYHVQPTKLLTVSYYDNYKFLELMSDNVRNHMQFSAFENSDTCSTKGLLTGTRTYYLDGSNNYSETVYYYDYRGREIQRRSTNHLGGYDVLSTKYDFVNNITDTWSSQSTSDGTTTTEHYHYTYDHANRPLTTTYTFNNESPVVLQSYHYDELGRVRSRHIHNGIDSVAFNYDIRNQITQIKSSGYEQKYYYNQLCPIYNGNVEGLYNGNINATTWTYENSLNGYVYRYDQMNRLVNTYSIHDGVWAFRQNSESFNYDAHGNITRLIRWGSSNTIDDISFTYNGNQLDKIDDEYESNSYLIKQYHDNNSSTDNDFAYDANGNMIYDKDRGIAAIRYNLLNLPDEILFTNGNLIIHRYDATGNRLETRYLTPKIPTTVPLGKVLPSLIFPESFHITRDVFHNNIVYNVDTNDVFGIKFVHNPEGYIRYNNMNEHYHFYYIKDLLGNIRETYKIPNAGTKECVQRMQYYPSGLPWAASAGASEQPWKYNGKEFVEMHGLDEYDSKARWYYPAICRTTTMDPLAETYYPTSPYAWCGNNPVKNVDLDGMDVWELDANGEMIHHRQNSQVDSLYVTNSYGKTSGMEFERGTIQDMSTNHELAIEKEDHISPISLDLWNISTEEHAKTIFEFFADNTDVEWSWINSSKSNDSQYFLTTIHQKDKEAGASYLLNRKFIINKHVHSHPYSPQPSKADKSWANTLFQHNPNTILQIYYYTQYYQYDQNGFKITH